MKPKICRMHGVSFSKPAIDLGALRGWKDGIVKKLTGGLTGLAKARKVTVLQGTGTFASPTSIKVVAADGSSETVAFTSAIIGGRVGTDHTAVHSRMKNACA